jgi:anaerobic magnesium-protoporphyrin IX monomethyl ester cyclase
MGALRIALVYPYFRTKARSELLFSPLGVAYLAAQLHELGIETRVFDCTFSTLEQVQDALMSFRPGIVGIYCMVTLSRNTFRIAEMVRSHLPGCLLVVGGPLPTLYPENFSKSFDAIFRGEADISFPNFCRDFIRLKGGSHNKLADLPLADYPGLYIHQNGTRINNPIIHFPEEQIEHFPLPYRGDFDHAAYQRAGRLKDGTKTASIITTYGCPFDCDFCSKPVFGRFFRRRKLENVIDEVDQIKQLGYDKLWIADDSLTLDPAYLKEFCLRIAGREMTWSCLSRVTGLDAENVHLMKRGGCSRVYLGLETGSRETLRVMNKKATVDDGIRAVQLFHEAGIEAAAFFIVGYPGETIASIEETFKLALQLPLSEISFNVPFPLPGSRLFEKVGGLDKTKDWDRENEVTFVYHSEFDEAWLRGRIEETLRAFSAKNSPLAISSH